MSDRPEGTEPATPHRRSQLRKQGDVAVSREVGTAAGVWALAIVVGVAATSLGKTLALALKVQIQSIGQARPISAGVEAGIFAGFVGQQVFPWLAGLALAVGALAFVGASACFSSERLQLKPERLNPVSGLQRLVGFDTLIQLARSTASAVVVVSVCLLVLRSFAPEVIELASQNTAGIVASLQRAVWRCAAAAAIAMSVLAAIDVVVVRMRYEKRIRMTREELRQELKQHEGDPLIKRRRRQRHREMMQANIAHNVPTATVVLANPTHVSVALRYRQGLDAAPVVVAKGLDRVALKIRELARSSGVPVVENRTLARALHKQADMGQAIPAEFFKAVAEVLAYVFAQQQAQALRTSRHRGSRGRA